MITLTCFVTLSPGNVLSASSLLKSSCIFIPEFGSLGLSVLAVVNGFVTESLDVNQAKDPPILPTAKTPAIHKPITVSYTHLDVYKRQI